MSIAAHEGMVRLDETSFQELVDAAAPSEAQEEALAVPGVPEALAAVRSPLATLHLTVAGRGSLQPHRAWIDADTVALLLTVHDDDLQLMPAPPALLGAGLARLLRIGPRRVSERAPREVAADVLSDLFAGTEILRRSAFESLAVDRAWSLALTWPGGDRWMAGVDGPDGIWLVTGDEDQPVLEPITATDVWRRLSTLLLGLDPS